MKTRYEYRTMNEDSLLGLLSAEETIRCNVGVGAEEVVAAHRDVGYISDDKTKRQLADILKGGFRWVRSVGGVAVFERPVPPPRKKP